MSEQPRFTGPEKDRSFAGLVLDDEGKWVCNLEYASTEENGELVLDKLVISTDDDEYDLMTKARTVGIHQAVISDQYSTSGGFLETVPPNHILRVGMFAHEIGHRIGKNEPDLYQRILTHYHPEKLGRDNMTFSEFFRILEDFPNSREHFMQRLMGILGNNDALRVMEAMYWESARLRKEIFNEARAREEMGHPTEFATVAKIADLERLMELDQSLGRTIKDLHPTIAKEVLSLPLRIIEWLANGVAIEIMREVEEKLGINLLGRKYRYPGYADPFTIEEILNDGVEITYGHPEHLDLRSWTRVARLSIRNTIII